MNTRTLVAYGLAATMIGGSLVGATALLTDAGASPTTEVQIVQSDPGTDPIPVVTAPPNTTMATSPPAAMQAAAPSDERPDGHDEDESVEYEDNEDEDNEYEDHEDEDDHGQ